MNPMQLRLLASDDSLHLPVRCRRQIRGRRRFILTGQLTGDILLMARDPSPDGRVARCAVLHLDPPRNLDILRDLSVDPPTPPSVASKGAK